VEHHSHFGGPHVATWACMPQGFLGRSGKVGSHLLPHMPWHNRVSIYCGKDGYNSFLHKRPHYLQRPRPHGNRPQYRIGHAWSGMLGSQGILGIRRHQWHQPSLILPLLLLIQRGKGTGARSQPSRLREWEACAPCCTSDHCERSDPTCAQGAYGGAHSHHRAR